RAFFSTVDVDAEDPTPDSEANACALSAVDVSTIEDIRFEVACLDTVKLEIPEDMLEGEIRESMVSIPEVVGLIAHTALSTSTTPASQATTMDLVLSSLDSLRDKAQDALFAITSCICQPSATIKVNGRSYKVLRILGEGGFSFVYLVQDEHSGREFALKKIRCPTGQEGVREAMREVEAYRRFRHPNIIRIMDSAVVDDRDGEGKIVYLFLPYYRRGNLQDIINSNSIHNSHLSEHDILSYFLGTCKAVSAMHNFKAVVSLSNNGSSTSSHQPRPPSRQERREADDHRDDDSLLPHAEGDGEEGFSYHAGPLRPSPNRGPKIGRGVDVVFDGDEELESEQVAKDTPDGSAEVVPYAHRDIKPAYVGISYRCVALLLISEYIRNVMLSDDGTPILMDFGSAIKARIHIANRNQALIQQDLAAEQSTMPYRAPELFDVKTGTTLDEKVDIWSLGCLLYALAYSHSPFETNQTTEQGGSLAMAVMNAQYKYPRDSPYSEGFKNLIDSCLRLNAQERPTVDDLVRQTEELLRTVR
ncbi:hypothetical protein FRB99_007120, partial [Tulasnella sp. 403]